MEGLEIEVRGLGDVIFVPEGVTWEEYQDWLVALEEDPNAPPTWEPDPSPAETTDSDGTRHSP